VAGSCGHGNEPSGPMKCGDFFSDEKLLPSHEGCCSLKLDFQWKLLGHSEFSSY
jgi:hypothetical protein